MTQSLEGSVRNRIIYNTGRGFFFFFTKMRYNLIIVPKYTADSISLLLGMLKDDLFLR